MQRVLVIGPCGAGKSTLAAALAKRLDVPLFHIDQLNWKSGWVEGTKDELRDKLGAITATDRWLIDGNYGGTLDERLPRADTIVYLDYPIWLCVWRLGRRIAGSYGRTRPDMAEGCPERFDAKFLFYVIGWNRGPRLRTEAQLRGHEQKLVRLKNPIALAQWLATMKS